MSVKVLINGKHLPARLLAKEAFKDGPAEPKRIETLGTENGGSSITSELFLVRQHGQDCSQVMYIFWRDEFKPSGSR